MNTKLTLSAIALSAVMALSSGAALAHEKYRYDRGYDYGHGHHRHGHHRQDHHRHGPRNRVERVTVYETRYRGRPAYSRYNNDGDQVAGAIIGGVVGGIIGNQVGRGRGNRGITAAGVLSGALIGSELARH